MLVDGGSTSNPKHKPGHSKKPTDLLREVNRVIDAMVTLEGPIHTLVDQLARATPPVEAEYLPASLASVQERLLRLRRLLMAVGTCMGSEVGTAAVQPVQAETSFAPESEAGAAEAGIQGNC